ncbi:uncharacterized protein LOC131177879 [Hevea brasiliensis]|uniref:uncharacterized protein LOC131177879 n=1 Tax=Hevea brasiliensis TaxID=3981 RepID=UPI0025E18E14|nr:uncharacterized protein LOC131177879 [Hevea brasiliensis]
MVFLLQTIWNSRNEMVFRNITLTHHQVISMAIYFFEEFSSVQVPTSNPQTVALQSPTFWSPPHNFVKLNFDGAFNIPCNKSSIAVLARDSESMPCNWSCKRFTDGLDPLILEALACRKALVLAQSRGLKGIIMVEGDSLKVVNAIHNLPH